MNIFFLHFDPKTCAQMHVDKHVVKMILESVQLLCSAHHLHPNGEDLKLMKKYVKIEQKTQKNFKKEKKRQIQKRRKKKIKDTMKNIKKKFLNIMLNIVKKMLKKYQKEKKRNIKV